MKRTLLARAPAGVVACFMLAGCVSKTPPQDPKAAEGQSQPVPASRPARPAPRAILEQAAAKPPAELEGEGWKPMFDEKTLTGWRTTDFAGHGEVQCELGMILLNMGDPFTGINWTNSLPTMNYEIALEATRVQGSDFFCGLTVPVGTNFCSLIVGGWGGSLVGISSLDSMDASENETTKFVNFEQGRWYFIRLRITPNRIQAWIDKDKLIDVDTSGRRIAVRPGDIELSKPIGIASWQATAALRGIRFRSLASDSRP